MGTMMDWGSLLSLFCLVITGSISAYGIFSMHFDDNLVQRIGLSIVATGCGARIFERLTTDVPAPPPALLWSQVGLMFYAVGTVYRFWIQSHRHPERRRPPNRRGSLKTF